MPFTYVIPDLHGRYDLLMKAVVTIIEHSTVSRSATIVTLGDYVDRAHGSSLFARSTSSTRTARSSCRMGLEGGAAGYPG
jgi:hypothetical protein